MVDVCGSLMVNFRRGLFSVLLEKQNDRIVTGKRSRRRRDRFKVRFRLSFAHGLKPADRTQYTRDLFECPLQTLVHRLSMIPKNRETFA